MATERVQPIVIRTVIEKPGIILLILLVVLLALSVSGVGPVRGCLNACAKAHGKSDGPLRVMVLNVLHGFPSFEQLRSRLDHIASEIRRHDADLVLLQEVPWTLRTGDGVRYLAELTGLNHVSVRDNGNRWLLSFDTSLAILSRYPLTEAAVRELEPRAGLFEHRVALRVTAITSRGPVQIFVTHLTHGDREINRRQADSLADWVATATSGLTLVGGDFNAAPDSPQIEALSEMWIDAYPAVNRDASGFTCCIKDLKAGPGRTLDRRIDYLFLVPNRKVKVRRSRRILTEPFRWQGGWQWASDHAGLLTEIE